jgi:CheY-like chemotaxis protein
MARILVIEDNPANLDLMVYLLDAFGHTPVAAADGEVGIALIQDEKPHLIICDIQLPKLSGYEVVQWLKEEPALRTIPILAVTAYAMVGDRDKVLAAGFDGYLTKPIEPETFVSQVERFLNDTPSENSL